MDEERFRQFLKKGGRSKSAADRVVRLVSQFSQFLRAQRQGKRLDEANGMDLEAFVAWVEDQSQTSAKSHLWALTYYYEHTANEGMCGLARALREERIGRKPFALKDFRGVNPEHVERLAAVGIRNVRQMLEAGSTPEARQVLAESAGVPLDAVLELVKLADLSRLPGVKGIRARLYVDAGVDTVEKMAQWDPAELRAMIIEFVERTGFDGIATLAAEARSAVERARKLPRIVTY